ncbi:MAG: GTP cyclohydrolase IIa [Legionellales bacterium]
MDKSTLLKPERRKQVKHILIAEDNQAQLKLLQLQLLNAGFQVSTATNGREALDFMHKMVPDAVISDVLMPQLDGYKLCVEIRSNPDWAHIPVILQSSNYQEPEDIELAEKVAADAFLIRQADASELISLLISYMRKEATVKKLTPTNSLKEAHANRVIHQLERQMIRNQGLSEDINNMIKDHIELQYKASLDPLTGLPNRTILLERISLAISSIQPQEKIGIIFIDLDNFKSVNDTFGHFVGDALLNHVATRLKKVVARNDNIVARMGGDEFVAMVANQKDPSEVLQYATKILDNLSMPFKLEKHSLSMSCSLGISIYPDDGISSELLLKRADAAMYQSKTLGKNTLTFYSDSTNEAP